MKKFFAFLKSIFSKKETTYEAPVVEIKENPIEESTICEKVDVKENPIETEEGFVKVEEAPADEKPLGKPIEKASGPIKIIIDSGHGIETPGKRSPYSNCGVSPALDFYEWQWNRKIAREIVKRLKALGYDAEMLVTNKSDMPLAMRANKVNKICNEFGKNNVLLVSIHSNAAGNGSKWMNCRGWCAYTSVGQTNADKLAEYLYDAAEEHFVGMKIRTDMSDGDRDWESNFSILKNTYCPAVITENFFYDNVDDVKYLLSEKGQEEIIKVHVEGITEYISTL